MSSVFILEEPRNGMAWSIADKLHPAREYQFKAYTTFMSNEPSNYVVSIKFGFPGGISFVVEKFTSYVSNFTKGERFCTIVTDDGRRIAVSDNIMALRDYAKEIDSARKGFVNRLGDGIGNPYVIASKHT
jgi:hypothetical protein